MEIKNRKMKQLTIKELAPYLPYGLKCQVQGYFKERSYEPIIFDVIGLSKIYVQTNSIDVPYISVKPILRPLSDLYKDEILNEFYIRFGGGFTNIEVFKKSFQDSIVLGSILTEFNYEYMELFFELNIDVFGLIEQNLAVDINTLNK